MLRGSWREGDTGSSPFGKKTSKRPECTPKRVERKEEMNVPAWIQIAAYVAGVLGFIEATLFGLLVLWPSIRKQNQLARRMESFFSKVEQRGVDKLIDSL